MKNNFTLLLVCSYFYLTAQNKPNILWIVTDDQRVDALECYNQATTGKKESALGYVSSPNINKLASEGTMFVNAYCNAPVCGPSRGSMHAGRYPFRHGHYGFEQTHQNPDFVKPTFPQTLRDEGYQTAIFGKLGAYIYKWGPGQGFYSANHYDTEISFKQDLQKNGQGDLYYHSVWKGGNQGLEEVAPMPNGKKLKYFIKRKKGQELTKLDIKSRKTVDKTYDILRSYTRYNKTLIIGGENPKPSGETIDGKILQEFQGYLANQDKKYNTTWGKEANGVKSKEPLMVSLSFHLPHTPVLPPKEFRDQFKKLKYKVPNFSKGELETLPKQMQTYFRTGNMYDMTSKEKQQAIQDYYAFCAYGDYLIGEGVKSFKEYCKKNNQEYIILYTVGDHGWHLGEQGIEAKFAPYDTSYKGAIIMTSSNDKVTKGVIKKQFIEYVDIAPTLLQTGGVNIASKDYSYLDGYSLFDFMDNEKQKREYIIGETHLVAGHRATLRSKDFSFSMRTRPRNIKKMGPNENIKWALNCPIEKAEVALFDLRKDPMEQKNVATNKKYKALAEWFRKKLGNIVLGDGRIEAKWAEANTYKISNFAKGAHDGKLDIPISLIP